VFSERLWSVSRQSEMSRRLALGAEGFSRSNRPPAPSAFDALFQVRHGHEVIEVLR
jgi:hypothetical protein